MTHHPTGFSLRFLFECGLCAMTIGIFATSLIDSLQAEWTYENILGGLVLGGIFSVFFAPIACGVIPLDENFSGTLNARPGIVVAFGILLAIASGQAPLPVTAAGVRWLGPLCRVLLGIYRYARYAWLIFPPLGAAVGILYIKYLQSPLSQPEHATAMSIRTGQVKP